MIETDTELLHRETDFGGAFGPLVLGGVAPGLLLLRQASLLLALPLDAILRHGNEAPDRLPHRADLVPAVGLRQVHVHFAGRQLLHGRGQRTKRADHGEGQRYGKEEGKQHAAEAENQHGDEALHFNGGDAVGLGHDRFEGPVLHRLHALDPLTCQREPFGSRKASQIARYTALDDACTHRFQGRAVALHFGQHLLALV